MDRKFAEQWLNNLKEAWWNKDIEKAISLFTKTTFYQETPFMKTYTTFEEIKQEWQHIKNPCKWGICGGQSGFRRNTS